MIVIILMVMIMMIIMLVTIMIKMIKMIRNSVIKIRMMIRILKIVHIYIYFFQIRIFTSNISRKSPRGSTPNFTKTTVAMFPVIPLSPGAMALVLSIYNAYGMALIQREGTSPPLL